MSKGGRKPLAVPRDPRRVYIRRDLGAAVDLILLDPMREKVKYGALSDLINELLEKWLSERLLKEHLEHAPQPPQSE